MLITHQPPATCLGTCGEAPWSSAVKLDSPFSPAVSAHIYPTTTTAAIDTPETHGASRHRHCSRGCRSGKGTGEGRFAARQAKWYGTIVLNLPWKPQGLNGRGLDASDSRHHDVVLLPSFVFKQCWHIEFVDVYSRGSTPQSPAALHRVLATEMVAAAWDRPVQQLQDWTENTFVPLGLLPHALCPSLSEAMASMRRSHWALRSLRRSWQSGLSSGSQVLRSCGSPHPLHVLPSDSFFFSQTTDRMVAMTIHKKICCIT